MDQRRGHPQGDPGRPRPRPRGNPKGPLNTKEDRREMILKYQKLMENAHEIGLDEEALAGIQSDISKLQKEVEKEPPPGHQLESANLDLERARKRKLRAEEEVEEARENFQTKQEPLEEMGSQVRDAEQ